MHYQYKGLNLVVFQIVRIGLVQVQWCLQLIDHSQLQIVRIGIYHVVLLILRTHTHTHFISFIFTFGCLFKFRHGLGSLLFLGKDELNLGLFGLQL